ncbi:VgrG-related protein [Streptomyces crystallinus]|uniref:VgrG-related protein n=1 Tax=Streptomyces crystallinus TaxID=68191 RepID=A0ABP3QBU0_9ACTN
MPPIAFSSVLNVTFRGMELPSDIADLLVAGTVDQGVGVPASFRLTFRDPARLVLDKLKMKFGTEVVITPIADGQGTGVPLLTGEVTAMEVDFDGAGTFTVIRGYDYGHRLMRQRRVVAYRNQLASDIARTIAVQNGVRIGRIDTTRTLYEFLSQPNVSDWDFLARLADENKMVMSLDAKGRFHFVRPKASSGAPSTRTDSDKSPFVLRARRDILRLRAAVTAADQVGQVESRGWNVTTKKKIKETQRVSTDTSIGIGIDSARIARKFASAKLVETEAPYDTVSEVRHAAEALAADVTSSFAELEVVVRGNPKLRPGVPVALARVGSPFEGKYTVTSVQHVFGDGKHYESWVNVTGRQWRSLYGLASGGGGAEGGAARLPGVVNALVTDVQDPLEQGRVKLTFPWLDDTYVSDWVRSVQWGGKGGGGVFPMDVGDEVLVGFDRGALDHPFVIGGLYNGRDKPTPNAVPLHHGLKKQATRHTLSDRKGNRVDLLSQQTGPREQGVRIATGNDRLTISLDRTKTEITVDSAGAVSIKGGRSVSVEAGTDLDLRAKRNVSIRGGGSVSIQGSGLVSLRSLGGVVGVSAASVLDFKAGAAATMTAGAGVQINSTANVGIRAATLLLNGLVMVNNKKYPLPS